MPGRPPLDPAIAANRGLSPVQRAHLDAAAKAVAMDFVSAVKRTNAAQVERIARYLGPQGMYALAVVLAEAVQPGSLRLHVVTQVQDDGMPGSGEAA